MALLCSYTILFIYKSEQSIKAHVALSLEPYPYNSQESGEGNTRTNPPLREYSSRVWRNILNSSPVKPSSFFFLGPEDSGLELEINAPPAVADRCLCKEKRKKERKKERSVNFLSPGINMNVLFTQLKMCLMA